ncbi:MAG: hypothetical protein NW220_12775 [Leptolyngbyaceae cyanobacterium bins.349]|nr:hypothetical protein [Leptolyngbyaceae cyanobacterium bins.349]
MGSLNELDAMSLRGILGVSLFLLSLGCMNIGIWHYAKAKGYSNWVAALGCFNVYGLIVLLILPRRNP